MLLNSIFKYLEQFCDKRLILSQEVLIKQQNTERVVSS